MKHPRALVSVLALLSLVLALWACQRSAIPASDSTTTTQASSGSEPSNEAVNESADASVSD